MRTDKYTLILLMMTTLLTSCGEKEEKFEEMSVETLYNMAMNQYTDKSFLKAGKIFDEVEKQHPYSSWALRAQLMGAYCYYQAKKYESAEEGFQTFVQLHPSHPDVAYAYYMIGLCHYEQIPIIQRYQAASFDALDAFKELIRRFPNSMYAKDAQFKIDLINNHLAAKELEIGRWLLSSPNADKVLAATYHFNNVVQDYQTSSQVPEALYRLVECNLSLGLLEEAKKHAAILGHNYVNNEWYKRAYELINKK